MATESKIEWTEQTWNPVTGCTKISPGCKYCYAEKMSHRLQAMGASGYENAFELTLQPQRLNQPLGRKKATTYFVNSMSDLFHENVPDSYIEKVLSVMEQTPQHTYQVLTKRADRLPLFFCNKKAPGNMWLGVSVEDKEYGIPRIKQLQAVKNVKIKFLSVEPLLEDIGIINLDEIDWVIVGGESGKNARPMKEQWAISIRNQCEAANVAFFFKQWGGWGADGKKRAKIENGRILDGKLWDNYPDARI